MRRIRTKWDDTPPFSNDAPRIPAIPAFSRRRLRRPRCPRERPKFVGNLTRPLLVDERPPPAVAAVPAPLGAPSSLDPRWRLHRRRRCRLPFENNATRVGILTQPRSSLDTPSTTPEAARPRLCRRALLLRVRSMSAACPVDVTINIAPTAMSASPVVHSRSPRPFARLRARSWMTPKTTATV